MDMKEVREALNAGVTPSPDYPDLPNDLTAEELIAFDPKAELEYRMVKDQNPGMTRAMLMRHWRSFRIGRIFAPEDGKQKGSVGDALRKAAAELFRRGR